MAKKDYFLIADSETSQPSKKHRAKVADFGAVICDRKGEIMTRCAVLISGVYNNPETPLFFTSDKKGIWSKKGQDRRYSMYEKMLASGARMLASVNAVNRWLENVQGKYDPYLTAYNLAFDVDKCKNTEIDLTIFNKRFCLWHAAQAKWGRTKKYRNFVMENHGFNPPTELGNMSYKTNAEIMARYIFDNPELEDEPHTALEDVIDYELPILVKLVNSTKKENWLNPPAYSWHNYQVKDHFIAK